jgi:hydrophobic/amphiphilic exporter-1 (mainly G- bacteria), HAE1 family
MFSDYFIERPIFAGVIAAVLVILGGISAVYLPVQQYPDIAPPKVLVASFYNGANSETVESAVTSPLEQEINGVEGMRYMESQSTNDGRSSITVTFEHGRDIDKAVADVKNRVDLAAGRLPQEVKATGVTVLKQNDAFIMGVGIYDTSRQYSHEFLSNYVDRNVVEKLKRIRGLGRINMFGERKYAMRLWLDPIKLAARNLSASDVIIALSEQNLEVPAGQLGQHPLQQEQNYQLPVVVQGRLRDVPEFENLVIRMSANGTVIRLKDIGRAELGAEDYSQSVRWLREESVGFGLVQLPGTNALQLADQCRAMLDQAQKEFPKGIKYDLGFDPTSFIKESIKEVNKTLLEAIFFVVLVIFLFLQNWRTTVIPALTIPVSLVGTFFVMLLCGFSINLLTMFGLILATGIVVDDAIVVIENISRLLEENPDMTPLEAAEKGMKEVFGPVIATALVLIAVFTPVAFFPGTTGLLYQQFALTIAFSVAISAFNAITLTPSLSALFLRHTKPSTDGFWRVINGILNAIQNGFARLLKVAVGLRIPVMLIFAGLMAVTVMLFQLVPKGFIPTEDQGYFIVLVIGPEGTSFDYTKKVIQKVENIIMPHKEVNGVFAVNGFGFTGNAGNRAIMFVPMKPIGEREGHEHSAAAVLNKVRGPLMGITEAFVFAAEPPAVQGIGNTGGFDFYVQDKLGSASLNELAGAQFQVMGGSMQDKRLQGVRPNFNAESPMLKIDIKRDLATAMGIPISEITRTLQVYLGSAYINDFTFENRSYRVYTQADAPFRSTPDAFNRIYVRNLQNQLTPIKSVIDLKETTGPQIITHFNLQRAALLNGDAGPGASSGDAMMAMEKLSNQLPKQFGYEWSGIYREQAEAGGSQVLFMLLGIVFVYLVLAAQYESLIDPFIIVLSVPLAMLGALLAVWGRGTLFHMADMNNNIFTQIGMILLVGLASKNAILIVEFANHLHKEGKSIVESAITAATLRFRPIVMTSLAFIIGVVPLVFAEGAGSAARQVIGTTVFGGMIVSTLLSLFIVPVQYIVIKHAVYKAKAGWQRLRGQKQAPAQHV